MVFRDLHEFISFLESKGQLRRIKTPVRCELEITEITARLTKQNGPALLFENVIGYDIPVLTNIFGSPQRLAWGLGVDNLDALTDKMRGPLSYISGPFPSSLLDKLRALGDLAQLSSYGPKMVSSAPCQDVVLLADASLDELPVLKCWPQDAGRFITLPLVITADPETGRRNMGMYRLQVYDGRTTGIHWHRTKGGAEHYRRSEQKRRRFEVAVALGADPATIYAATAPLPPGIDELLFAGFLRGEAVEMVKCKVLDLEVPAQAEIILEGYVDPGERRTEGPFGDHTGYYSPAAEYPVFHLLCLTHRHQPIYPATIVGKPPMEDAHLGKATERLFLPLLQMMLPEMVDLNLPVEGVFQNLAIVSIKKEYAGQAKKVICALWGMMQMMLTKIIIVVDHYVNVHDLSEVIWRVTGNIDPRRDLLIIDGPLDDLDHASPLPQFGSKLGIDATAKWPEEGHPRVWPLEISMDEETKRLVDSRWGEYEI
ncbi:MAG: menaquinone biosynthesis decarboxylase [Chloroflexi bacterium]|nr:menaquinone biosynthesis decarboxylase [Chloroflexota bacterium]MCL5076454.1 menaquinone biosynthesis decarboxylase [Chloroflexota bacterium]